MFGKLLSLAHFLNFLNNYEKIILGFSAKLTSKNICFMSSGTLWY